MTRSARRMGRKEKPAACPFCDEGIPRPADLAPDRPDWEVEGGRCGCGALYVADITGKGGGQALLDALTLLCRGSSDDALALQAGTDYELQKVGYRPGTHSLEARMPDRGAYGMPKLWFVRRLGPPGCA